MSQAANRDWETRLEFQISPTYSKPPCVGRGEKRNVKKPAWNCHLLVNIPQLAGTGFIGYIIHCGLFAQI